MFFLLYYFCFLQRFIKDNKFLKLKEVIKPLIILEDFKKMAENVTLKKLNEIDITDKFHYPERVMFIDELAIDPFNGNVLLFLRQGKDISHRICIFDSELEKEIIISDTQELLELEHLVSALFRKEDLVVGDRDTNALYFFEKQKYTKTREPLQLEQPKEGPLKHYPSQIGGKPDGTLYVLLTSHIYFVGGVYLYHFDPQEKIRRYERNQFGVIATDNQGNLFGASGLNHLLIQSINPDGSITNLVEQKRSVYIYGLALDQKGRIYINVMNRLEYYDKGTQRFEMVFRDIYDVDVFGIDNQNNLYLCHTTVRNISDIRVKLAKYKITH